MGNYAVKLQRSTPLELPRHPEAAADEDFEAWCEREVSRGQRLAIDLFSGAGGLGLGVEKAGWTVVMSVDHDARALDTHRANFAGIAVQADMADPYQVDDVIQRVRRVPIDLIVGGPPCQPFSRAGMSKIRSLVRDGHRDELDRRRELWRSFVDVVEAVRPRAVLMENVPDMALGDDLRIVREIANRLEVVGYSVDYRLLDAWRYGVPQHRKRFFLQARTDALPIWPAPKAKRPAVRDAIEDLPRLGMTTGARELPRQSRPISEFALELIGEEKEHPVFDHMTRPVRDDDREAFKLMSAKTLYSDLPEHLRRYRSDTFDDKYKRLSWEDLSRTITAHIAKDGYWYIHPEEHRTLTVREAARIQTFPDKFRFAGTRSDAFRQIGNAVPPALSAAVSSTLADATVSEDRQSVPILRRAIDQWAERRRQEAWWLFPGPGMGAGAALVAALLEVHRMGDEVAGAIMLPFRGLERLSMRDLLEVDALNLSASRRRGMRRLRDLARAENGEVELHDASKSVLSAGQNVTMDLLLNTEHLILSERIGLVVATLLGLPQESRGLKTDLKVGLAQLVGTGTDAAARMCALRIMTVSAARSSVEVQGKL